MWQLLHPSEATERRLCRRSTCGAPSMPPHSCSRCLAAAAENAQHTACALALMRCCHAVQSCVAAHVLRQKGSAMRCGVCIAPRSSVSAGLDGAHMQGSLEKVAGVGCEWRMQFVVDTQQGALLPNGPSQRGPWPVGSPKSAPRPHLHRRLLLTARVRAAKCACTVHSMVSGLCIAA